MRDCALHRSRLLCTGLLLASLLCAAPAAAQVVAFDDSYTTNEDVTLTRTAAAGVRANDNLGGLASNSVDVVVVPNTGPNNGTLSIGQNGNFTYVPNANFNGTDNFVYQLRYPVLGLPVLSNPATVTIVVTPQNDAAAGVVNRSYTTTENVALSVPAPGVLAGVNDPDGPVTAAVVTNVATGALSLSPDGAFTFTPATGFDGTVTFTYRAVDANGGLSNTATVTITVAGINDPPVANNDAYLATEDLVLSVATRAAGVLGNDTDPDTGQTATLTAVIATQPPATEGLVTLNANGTFTFSPAPNFYGTTSFTYNARDTATPPATSAAPATVTITVNPVNDAPTAVADAFQTTENVPSVVPPPGVLANDTDVDSSGLTAQQVTNVAANAGTAVLNPSGGFTYTPAPGFSGIATFTYRTVDNGTPPVQSATTTTVTITVQNINDPPVAAADTYTTSEDTALTIGAPGVLSNDTDPDPSTILTAAVASPPTHGSLTLNPNGSFVYAPALDYEGPDSFTYHALDNGTPPLQSALATVTLNVASGNDAPRLAPGITTIPDQAATENVPLTPLALAQYFVDPEGSQLSFIVAGLPMGLAATPFGEITGTPTIGATAGTHTVDVTVSDGQNQFSTSFTLLVLAAGRTDLALSGSATPSPALINQLVTWTFTIENRSPTENVGNVALQMAFVGPASFAVTPSPGCTATPQLDRTTVLCTAGPILANGQATISAAASSAQPGDVVAIGQVTITDRVPVDAAAENDTASVVVNITQTVAAGPAQTIPATRHRASATGDFNGDGFIDLAVAAEGAGGTLIYPNVLDASTPGSTRRLLATEPLVLGDSGVGTDIKVADLDSDGALDLVAGKASGATVLLRNPRDGTFAFRIVTNAFGAPEDSTNSVAANDVDGDGRIDVVLGNSSPNRVFMNQGGGNFTELLPALGDDDTRDTALVDLVGDTALELVFANANRGATVYTFNRATNRYQETVLSNVGAATAVAAADFDGNGRMDLVFGRSQSTLVLFNATPPGAALQFSAPLDLGPSPNTDVLAVDTDADGDVDIVGIQASGSHRIYSNNGVGQFTLRPQQFASSGALNASAAKLSVDDRVDLAVIGTSSVDVFYNDGTGNFGKGDLTPPVIRLLGQAAMELTVQSAYTDAGATAADSIDGDLTAKIKIDNPVDTAVVGTYTVTYTVLDSSGNAATATRSVKVNVRAGSGGGGGGAIDLIALLSLTAVLLLGTLRSLTISRRAT